MKLFNFLCLSILCTTQLLPCTGMLVQAEDGSSVNGRTVEFGVPLDMSLAVVPRNISFTGKTPVGNGMSYKSKYAAAGIYTFEDVILMDGINEKGLVAAAFYFPGYASYAKVTKKNQKKALSPVDFPNWILTQFASIEEVKKGVESVIIAPTVLKNWGEAPPPMHYIVYDQSGNSIVIEPIDGSLKVYDNKLGVITNSPTFDWQTTNLNNYINLTPYNVVPHQLDKLKFTSFGQGTGMLGLPGDFTPPSRFVRAAFFSALATPSKNGEEAVNQIFRLLNQFDIPSGVVAQKEDGKTTYDYTLLTSVKNPQTLEYLYRSYQNQAIQYINLSQFDFNAKSIKTMKVQGTQQKYNVSSQLE
ncbi:MAG: choloylglycine hydrolase family protein [Simkaniaceae bacterium]|nr:choloylglycine hydrolase family protein [Simkaniaceae bacterium]